MANDCGLRAEDTRDRSLRPSGDRGHGPRDSPVPFQGPKTGVATLPAPTTALNSGFRRTAVCADRLPRGARASERGKSVDRLPTSAIRCAVRLELWASRTFPDKSRSSPRERQTFVLSVSFRRMKFRFFDCTFWHLPWSSSRSPPMTRYGTEASCSPRATRRCHCANIAKLLRPLRRLLLSDSMVKNSRLW